MMKMNLKLFKIILVPVCSLVILSCQKSTSTNTETVTDYAKGEYWLSLPADNTKDVDIFYVYPTAGLRRARTNPTIVPLIIQ